MSPEAETEQFTSDVISQDLDSLFTAATSRYYAVQLMGNFPMTTSFIWSVGWFVCRSVIISLKGGKLHFHAPIGVYKTPPKCHYNFSTKSKNYFFNDQGVESFLHANCIVFQ